MAAGVDRGRPPLALTMGDPAGIGIEITLMAWRDRHVAAVPPFVLYTDADAVAQRARALSIELPIEVIDNPTHAAEVFPSRLPVHSVPVASLPVAGQPNSANAGATIRSIEDALAAVVRGEASALVTNPISKAALYGAGFKHAGHTEFLASLAEAREPGRRYHPVMLLASDELKVVPLTVHVPLADVPKSITKPAIHETARILWHALRHDFGFKAPRIAVAGLNPHAGEGGAIGREEEDVIAPAIRELQSEGLDVTGPHSADTLFHDQARARYDAVLAMYHDQALIPLKTLAFDRGVNVTLGLPFIRTSPDHGTAFDIAGSGTARPNSLIASLRLADTLSARRAKAGGNR